jgi:hypothetical protein
MMLMARDQYYFRNIFAKTHKKLVVKKIANFSLKSVQIPEMVITTLTLGFRLLPHDQGADGFLDDADQAQRRQVLHARCVSVNRNTLPTWSQSYDQELQRNE